MFGHKDKNDDKRLSSRLLSMASAGAAGIGAWKWATRYGYRAKTILGRQYMVPKFNQMFEETLDTANAMTMDPAARLDLIERSKIWTTTPHSTERLADEITEIRKRIMGMQKKYDNMIEKFIKIGRDNHKAIRRELKGRQIFGKDYLKYNFLDYLEKHADDPFKLGKDSASSGILLKHWEETLGKYRNENFLDSVYVRIINKYPILTKNTIETTAGLHTVTEEILHDLKGDLMAKSNKIGINLSALEGQERNLILGNSRVAKSMMDVIERLTVINDPVKYGTLTTARTVTETMYGSLDIANAFNSIPDANDPSSVSVAKFMEVLHGKWKTSMRTQYNRDIRRTLAKTGLKDIYKPMLQRHPESITLGNTGQVALDNAITGIMRDIHFFETEMNYQVDNIVQRFQKVPGGSNRLLFDITTRGKDGKTGKFTITMPFAKHRTWAFSPTATTVDMQQAVLGTNDEFFLQRWRIRKVLVGAFPDSLDPQRSQQLQGNIDAYLAGGITGSPSINNEFNSAYVTSKVSTPRASFQNSGMMKQLKELAPKLKDFKEEDFLHSLDFEFDKDRVTREPYIQKISITTFKRHRNSINLVDKITVDNQIELVISENVKRDGEYSYKMSKNIPSNEDKIFKAKNRMEYPEIIKEKNLPEILKRYMGRGKIMSKAGPMPGSDADQLYYTLQKHFKGSPVGDLLLATDKSLWIDSQMMEKAHLTNLPAAALKGGFNAIGNYIPLVQDLEEYMMTADPENYSKMIAFKQHLQKMSKVGIKDIGIAHEIPKYDATLASYYAMSISDFRWNKFKGMSSFEEFLDNNYGTFEKSYQQGFVSSSSYSKGIVSLMDVDRILPGRSWGPFTTPVSQIMNAVPLLPKPGGPVDKAGRRIRPFVHKATKDLWSQHPMTDLFKTMTILLDPTMNDGELYMNQQFLNKYDAVETGVAAIKLKATDIPDEIRPFLHKGQIIRPNQFGGEISFGKGMDGQHKTYSGKVPIEIIEEPITHGGETVVKYGRRYPLGRTTKFHFGAYLRGTLGKVFNMYNSATEGVAGRDIIGKQDGAHMISAMVGHVIEYTRNMNHTTQSLFIETFNRLLSDGDGMTILQSVRKQGQIEIQWIAEGVDFRNVPVSTATDTISKIFKVMSESEMMQNVPQHNREHLIAEGLWTQKGGWSIKAGGVQLDRIIQFNKSAGYNQMLREWMAYGVDPNTKDPMFRSVQSIVDSIKDAKYGPKNMQKLLNRQGVPSLLDMVKLYFPKGRHETRGGIVSAEAVSADSSMPFWGTSKNLVKVGPYLYRNLKSTIEASDLHDFLLSSIQDQSFEVLGRPKAFLAVGSGQIPAPGINLGDWLSTLEKDITKSDEASAWNAMLHASPSNARGRENMFYKVQGKEFSQADYIRLRSEGSEIAEHMKPVDINSIMSRLYNKRDTRIIEYLRGQRGGYLQLPAGGVNVTHPGRFGGETNITKFIAFQ